MRRVKLWRRERTTPPLRSVRSFLNCTLGAAAGNLGVVLGVKPSAEALGNGIDLVDWSPSGHRLLLTQGAWRWGSDVSATLVRTYDADTETLSSERSMEEALRRQFGSGCLGVFQPLGFSPEGRLVIRAGPNVRCWRGCAGEGVLRSVRADTARPALSTAAAPVPGSTVAEKPATGMGQRMVAYISVRISSRTWGASGWSAAWGRRRNRLRLSA
jgi:hypothetical protein